MVQTYNELKVRLDNKGNVIDKVKTERGTVRISEFTASVNNGIMHSTHLLYELAEEQPEEKKKPGRKPNLK